MLPLEDVDMVSQYSGIASTEDSESEYFEDNFTMEDFFSDLQVELRDDIRGIKHGMKHTVDASERRMVRRMRTMRQDIDALLHEARYVAQEMARVEKEKAEDEDELDRICDAPGRTEGDDTEKQELDLMVMMAYRMLHTYKTLLGMLLARIKAMRKYSSSVAADQKVKEASNIPTGKSSRQKPANVSGGSKVAGKSGALSHDKTAKSGAKKK